MPQTLHFSKDDGPSEVARDEAAQREAAQTDEANMRRALGMLGGAPRHKQPNPSQPTPTRDRRAAPIPAASNRRHRFVQDGDVPVTVMRNHAAEPAQAAPGASPKRIEALEATLAGEKTARERAERALEEAQATIRDLRTKLAHTELAREEALRQRDAPEPVAAEVIADPPVAAPERLRRPVGRPPKAAAPPRPPRPAKEPKPVKWWVKPRAGAAKVKS